MGGRPRMGEELDPAMLAAVVGGRSQMPKLPTEGDDHLDGTSGADEKGGRGGNDVVNGHGGNDTLKGGAGEDVLNGGSHDDLLAGGVGADQVNGGSGNDTFIWTLGEGNDTIVGGEGHDVLRIEGKTVPIHTVAYLIQLDEGSPPWRMENGEIIVTGCSGTVQVGTEVMRFSGLERIVVSLNVTQLNGR